MENDSRYQILTISLLHLSGVRVGVSSQLDILINIMRGRGDVWPHVILDHVKVGGIFSDNIYLCILLSVLCAVSSFG